MTILDFDTAWEAMSPTERENLSWALDRLKFLRPSSRDYMRAAWSIYLVSTTEVKTRAGFNSSINRGISKDIEIGPKPFPLYWFKAFAKHLAAQLTSLEFNSTFNIGPQEQQTYHFGPELLGTTDCFALGPEGAVAEKVLIKTSGDSIIFYFDGSPTELTHDTYGVAYYPDSLYLPHARFSRMVYSPAELDAAGTYYEVTDLETVYLP